MNLSAPKSPSRILQEQERASPASKRSAQSRFVTLYLQDIELEGELVPNGEKNGLPQYQLVVRTGSSNNRQMLANELSALKSGAQITVMLNDGQSINGTLHSVDLEGQQGPVYVVCRFGWPEFGLGVLVGALGLLIVLSL